MSYKPEEEEVDYEEDNRSEASEEDLEEPQREIEDDEEGGLDENDESDVDDENKLIEDIVRDEGDIIEPKMTLGQARRVGIELEEEDTEDESDEEDFEKFDKDLKDNLIESYHPELKTLNYEEIEALCVVVRNKNGMIVDPLHKTVPILSRYERARILGERADQLNSGAEPFIEVDQTMIDGYLIALRELEEKKIPFIIQRPLPNGGCEYWRLKDLEIL